MPKITKRVVDGLQPGPSGSDVFAWDTELKGFGVRVKPSGSAAYLVQYRNKQGRTRRFTIGKVGVLTPDQARDLARGALASVSQGEDPSADRHRIRKAITVSELCDLYLRHAQGHIKDSTLAMDRSRVERHVKPLLGRHTVASVTHADIVRLQDDIAMGRSAERQERALKAAATAAVEATDAKPKRPRGGKTTGGKGVASRTVGMLGTIFEFARRHGIVEVNPARGVEKFPDVKRQRFLSFEEIKQLGEAMSVATTECATALDAIRLLLLTGCRRMEVLTLRQDEVDLSGQCLRLGDTKSGAQIRPIGAAAVNLLRERSGQARGGYVFPSERGEGHFVGLPRSLARLCKSAQIDGVTVHVLRHTFAATAASMGFSELTIAGLLGHRVHGVTARYAHVPDTALQAAASAVASRIDASLAGKPADANVVPLHSVIGAA